MMWKTLAAQCIYEGSNDTKVKQNWAYRWLTLGSDAIQTLIHRRHPEQIGLQYIQALTLAARAAPAPSCLLGLGGAGVAHALAPCFGEYQLDAVESSREVIDIAAAYFMTEQIKNLNIIHEDAFLFVQHAQTSYQHLMVDLFNAYSFPAHCNNAAFFSHCHRILLPNGVLAVNLAKLDEQWPVFMHIRHHFGQCIVSIPVKHTANMVVLACKSVSVKPILNILDKHLGLKRLTWDSRWGCVAEMDNH